MAGSGGGGSSRAHKDQLRVQDSPESTVDTVKNRGRNIDRTLDAMESGTDKAPEPKVRNTSKPMMGGPMDEVKKFLGIKSDTE